jgi:hypothetical protein
VHVCQADGAFFGGSCVEVSACASDQDNDCAADALCVDAGAGAHTCECKQNFFGDGAACEAWTRCAAGATYQGAAPTSELDRSCAVVTVCGPGQYVHTPATLWADTVCATCSKGTYQVLLN